MKNKYSITRGLDILFWSVIIFMDLIEVCKNFSEIIEGISFNPITFVACLEFVYSLLIFMVIYTFANLMKLFFITAAYFAFKIAHLTHYTSKIEKVDIKNDDYFRDILPKYSPAVLSYIDDFKLDIKDVIATIMMLEVKGKVKINDKDITAVNSSTDDLEENEKYVYEKIVYGKLSELDIMWYINLVKADAYKLGLLHEQKADKKVIIKKIIECILLFYAIGYVIPYLVNLFNFEVNLDNPIIVGIIVVITLLAFLLINPFVAVFYILNKAFFNSLDPYIRSKEGKRLNIKLEGLRKYLKDFGDLDDKSEDHLILWNEYLIYSVIFGINNKLIMEIYNKFD